MPITKEAQQNVQAALDKCTDPSSGTGVPGLVFCAIDKNGEYLTKNASGFRGLHSSAMASKSSSPGSSAMDMDSVFWIASCTKMITGIAAMQLVEQGKLSLDDHNVLYKVCPELKEKQVLDDSGKLVPRQGEITLRLLLSHTAGFGYSFFNEKLRDYAMPTGWDEFSGDRKDYLNMPLVNQPGTKWEYGINIDWAGMAVERVSGLTLDEYFKKNIFEPLGLKDISFFPNQHMRENLVNAQARFGSETRDVDHPLRRSVWLADDEKDKIMCTGGAGCFAKPAEYCQILATLLNNGTSPTTKQTILKPETVDEMFKNQIESMPDYGRNPISAAKPYWTNPLPELYPQEGNPPQGWGLTFMNTIEPGPTGRGKNTVWWAGIVNLFWWCDREKGVAGMIAAQILPFGDPHVMGAWFAAEGAIYAGLQ